MLSTRYPEFTKVMSEVEYIYLSPSDFDTHKQRLAKKQGEEINHLDPVGDEAIRKQIQDYWNFAQDHQRIGLLGSYNVKTYLV